MMKYVIQLCLALLMTMSVSTLSAQQVDGKKDQKSTSVPLGVQKNKVKGKPTKMKAEMKTINSGREGYDVDPETLITNAFPNKGKVVEDKVWNQVFDGKGELMGYVVYSSPASDSIRGYAGPTPLLIAFNTDKTIRSVQMMSNKETPRFYQHVMESKLLESWNGLTVKKAQKKKVDTVSGATFTSRSIIESMKAALKRL